jgi:hypothetical protein
MTCRHKTAHQVIYQPPTYASTAKDEEVGVFRDDPVYKPFALEETQLRVGLVGRNDVIHLLRPQSLVFRTDLDLVSDNAHLDELKRELGGDVQTLCVTFSRFSRPLLPFQRLCLGHVLFPGPKRERCSA